MTSTADSRTTTVPAPRTHDERVRTARITGLWYLGLGVTGMVGFLLIRAQLFVPADPAATLANLGEQASLARLGVALEMGVVVTQTLTALWFYRLFRRVDSFAAGALATFGLLNAVAIMGSAALLATAAEVAADPAGSIATDTGAAAGVVQLSYTIADHFWGAGTAFFGLWLIPMGRLILRSGWLPAPLGWTLLAGGVGYLVSAFIGYLFPGADTLTTILTVPATVGELWTLSYLIVVGVRRTETPAP
ncbi:DUF4386 domain-containing protein [Ruania halotolerans]|uniref:DUF4386 domain-containing protein n=1 Tax=Ruania halotolerans TaxID=2897773 RepID=UPI001E2F7F7C|nr:DUF4386 domain-containing protein [Ruania halotolerans]UFU05571.1 DUF4386 domain-containing protein [Ruania halotolerans]